MTEFSEVGQVPPKIGNFTHTATLPCRLGSTVLGRKEKTNVWRRPRLQTVGRVGRKEELPPPSFSYYLDESDPDIVILRRKEGSFVAAFIAREATGEGILEAAKEDYGQLVQAYAAQEVQVAEGKRSHQSA